MAEIITPKRVPLFGEGKKKSFFRSKKFVAICAIVLIAIVVIVVVLLLGTEYNEELIDKTALLIPLFYKKN